MCDWKGEELCASRLSSTIFRYAILMWTFGFIIEALPNVISIFDIYAVDAAR